MHTRSRHAHADMFGLAHHAGKYDRSAGRIAGRLYRRIAADVTSAGLPDDAVVLDVGTGPGRVPLLITAACPGIRVEGVDLSEAMIVHANEAANMAGQSSDRLSFAVADVSHLPHADGSVDLVVSSLSLHHWEDPAAGLREVARVLAPDGQAWIYDVRWVLRRVEPLVRDRGVDVHRDSPLVGTPWINPMGRLVLRRG